MMLVLAVNTEVGMSVGTLCFMVYTPEHVELVLSPTLDGQKLILQFFAIMETNQNQQKITFFVGYQRLTMVRAWMEMIGATFIPKY